MFTKNEILSLKKRLPTKGIKTINKQTKVSVTTIYKFFNGIKVKENTAEKIWIAGWEIIKKQEQKAEKLKTLMSTHDGQTINDN